MMRPRVAIFGAAGTVGSCTAFTIAKEGLAQEIILFDPRKNLLKSHLMDLRSATTGVHDVEIRLGEKSPDARGVDIVIVSASTPSRKIASRLELLSDNTAILAEISRVIQEQCANCVVVNVANPVDPLTYLLWRSTGLKRKQCLGFSLNDTVRFRRAIADRLGVPVVSVDAIVIGEHGEHAVCLFSSVRVRGIQIEIQPEMRRNILADVSNALHAFESLGVGRTTGWTSAVGLAAIVRAIANDTSEQFPCSMVLEGEYNRYGFAATLPVSVGRDGIERCIVPRLDQEESHRLERCFDFLEAVVGHLDGI